jgi:hypothetical protein
MDQKEERKMGSKNTAHQPEENLNPEDKEQAVNEFTEVLKEEFPEGSLLEQCLQRRNHLEAQNFRSEMRERDEALRDLRQNIKVDPEVIRRMGIK